MKQKLKIAGVIIGSLLATVLVALITIYLITESRWNRTYELYSEPIEVRDDSTSIADGKHIFTIRGCLECHGANLAGQVYIEDPIVGRMVPANLTTGEGGIDSTRTDEDLVRSIRRGIKPDGRSVFFMPSHEYNLINRQDMENLISYIRSAPPVDNVLPENIIAMPMRAIYLLTGDVPLFPAEDVDQSIVMPETVPQTPLELGEYLAATCVGCHGAGYSGGAIPGAPPDWPPASNITPAGNIGNWSLDQFTQTLRTGITPEGVELGALYMPYQIFGAMTDEELSALFSYLQTLEPRADGNH